LCIDLQEVFCKGGKSDDYKEHPVGSRYLGES